MNRKGQAGGIIGFVIIQMIFIINWALWLGAFIGTLGPSAIASGATGTEAFLWSNLNYFIFCLLILVNLLVFSYRGDS